MQRSLLFHKRAKIYLPKKATPRQFGAFTVKQEISSDEYHSKDHGKYGQVKRTINETSEAYKKQVDLGSRGISWQTYKSMGFGKFPENSAEKHLSEKMAASEYSLERWKPDKLIDQEYFANKRNHYMRSLVTRIKNIRNPGVEMYQKSKNALRLESKEAKQIDSFQCRLHETGITSEQRLDAYFLGDESIFPEWAKNLSESLRDRVIYGGIGINEHDEALRSKLLELPMSIRKAKWERMKQNRRMHDGTERMITSDEKQSVTRGYRKYKWHLISRLEHKARMGVLRARNPSHQEHDSRLEEITQPIRTVANYVHSGLPTLGSPHLDGEAAEKRIAIMREDERIGLFVHKSNFVSSNIDPRVQSTLSGVDMLAAKHMKEKRIKRISHRCFKNRWGGIMSGSIDECGRKIVEEKNIFSQNQAHKSFIDFARERHEMGMPMPHAKPQLGQSNEPWPQRYKYKNSTFSVGLPSPNRGWY